MLDRVRLFLGLPNPINKVMNIYSPMIKDIASIGEQNYYVYLTLTTFDKEKILCDLFGFDPKDVNSFVGFDDYVVLCDYEIIRTYICEALSFFTKKIVEFDTYDMSFKIDGQFFVNKANCNEISSIISLSNGMEPRKEEPKFKNSKAREMYEKLQQMRKKAKKSSGDKLDLKDMLSIVCNADGNGINVFNISDMTIYQVYEHFERLNLKEDHKRVLPVWASGNLGENNKLPEWIAKTKL